MAPTCRVSMRPSMAPDRRHECMRRLSLLHWCLPFVQTTMLSSLQECHPFLAELIHVWAITQIFSFSRDYEWYYVKKLGEGGFKRVFECRRENEVAAISVMEPRESGLRNVAQLELRCLLLLSLVREKMNLPFFMRLVDAFSCDQLPAPISYSFDHETKESLLPNTNSMVPSENDAVMSPPVPNPSNSVGSPSSHPLSAFSSLSNSHFRPSCGKYVCFVTELLAGDAETLLRSTLLPQDQLVSLVMQMGASLFIAYTAVVVILSSHKVPRCSLRRETSKLLRRFFSRQASSHSETSLGEFPSPSSQRHGLPSPSGRFRNCGNRSRRSHRYRSGQFFPRF